LSAAKPIAFSQAQEGAIPNYRRNLLPGGTYFFTVNLADRRLALLTEHISLLRVAFRSVRATYPFTIEAAVILPDHLHAIWTLPEQDADFAMRWRLIKNASHAVCREASGSQPAVSVKASAGSGNGGIGSIHFATKKISAGILTIFTSIQ
jgi:putative transposase